MKEPAAVSRSGPTLPSGRLAGDGEFQRFCEKRTSRRNIIIQNHSAPGTCFAGPKFVSNSFPFMHTIVPFVGNRTGKRVLPVTIEPRLLQHVAAHDAISNVGNLLLLNRPFNDPTQTRFVGFEGRGARDEVFTIKGFPQSQRA